MNRLYRATCKKTGRKYPYELKIVWGERRYSVDNGYTWFPRLSEAKADAIARNMFRYDGDHPLVHIVD